MAPAEISVWGGGPAGAYGGSPTGMRGMETNVQDSHNGVDQKEERNIQPEQNEETRIQKNEERLRNLQDIFKRSNIQIIGC